jgi:hypothetical protein
VSRWGGKNLLGGFVLTSPDREEAKAEAWDGKFFESRNRTAGKPETVCPRKGASKTLLKGLILAQNERWRRGLGMQVGGASNGNRRKGQ